MTFGRRKRPVRWTATASVTVALLAASFLLFHPERAVSQPEGSLSFQTLTSRSGPIDVLKAFPRANHESQCFNGAKVSRSADGETACDTLVVQKYNVDNTDFDLTFIFGTEGTLRYVSLIHGYGTFGPQGTGVPKADIQLRFNSISDLLATRYGPAVKNPPGYLSYPTDQIGQLEWQPGRGTEWMSGGDRVELSAEARQLKSDLSLFNGVLQIFYTFGRRSEGSKL
jgi:hypothetical protein